MHDLIRQQLRERLAARGIGGYLPQTEPNLFYVTGYQSAWIDLSWRWMGLETAFLPTDPTREPVLLVCDYSETAARFQADLDDVRTFGVWVECREPEVVMNGPPSARLTRPEQYDPGEVFGTIRQIITEAGLADAVIGTDLGVMRKETYDGLCAALPGCTWVDVSDLLYDMRKIKRPEEMPRLRNAASVFDMALTQSMALVREDMGLAELRANFDGAVTGILRANPELGEYQGTFGFNSIGCGDVNRVRPGDIIKVDAGVRLDGYWSDCARVFCYGEPTDLQARIHSALLAGFEAAEAVLRPGATMHEVYTSALETVRSYGFPNYSRGHFGHSIGLDDQTEEPPFIGPNDTVVEPGMALCLELPYYPAGVGCFNIEDVFLITADGVECLNTAPRSLIRLPM